MQENANIFGFVQAGGGSTRFGSDKALSVLSGKTTLVRTTELLRSVCGVVRIIAGPGKYPEAPAEILSDRWPGEGPLGGILTALTQGSSNRNAVKWNLIVGCDMPFLTRDWLEFLCGRALASEAQVVVAESDMGLEPLCACWSSEATETLQQAFNGGVRKVTQAMKLLPMEVLDESAWKRFDTGGRLFWNMNTPEDFEEARRIIERE